MRRWVDRRAPLNDDPLAIERELAAYYDQESAERAARPIDAPRIEARERFVERARGARRVLDVGAGPGRDAAALAAAGFDVVAVDLSLEHLRHAAAGGVVGARGSVRALPIATGSVDAVWTMSTLMHVPDPAIGGALREIARVLRPGGLAAIGVWGGPDVVKRHESDRYDPPRFFSRRSDDRWRSLLAGAGELVEFVTWGHDDEGDEFWYQWAVVRA